MGSSAEPAPTSSFGQAGDSVQWNRVPPAIDPPLGPIGAMLVIADDRAVSHRETKPGFISQVPLEQHGSTSRRSLSARTYRYP